MIEGVKLGRHRKNEIDKKSNVWVYLPNYIIFELEKEGKINDVIRKIVLEYYQKKVQNDK